MIGRFDSLLLVISVVLGTIIAETGMKTSSSGAVGHTQERPVFSMPLKTITSARKKVLLIDYHLWEYNPLCILAGFSYVDHPLAGIFSQSHYDQPMDDRFGSQMTTLTKIKIWC